ncbi:MAG: von Willebrand factor type A domain-containing protein [Thermoanaerobaculia bacterium]
MNSNHSNDKLDRALRDFPTPPPPAGLLEKIQAEIPSGEELAGESTTAGSAPRHWPLRLAATFVLAAVGATVAWQVVKSRQGHELDRQAADFVAPTGKDESSRFAAAPPPPKAAAPKPQMMTAPVPSAVQAPTSADSAGGSYSVKGDRQRQAAQPVEEQETAYAVHTPPRLAEEVSAVEGVEGSVSSDLADDTPTGEAGGVPGGVYGGVVGGVAGGVAGGAVGGVPSVSAAAAAPKPAGSTSDLMAKMKAEGRYSVAYDSISSPGEGLADPRENSTERRERYREEEGTRQATPGTMIFRETPANRFVATDEDRLSTFALDVDTGSYTLTRGYLDRGLLPPPAAIRVEEFVNAQTYDDAPPRSGSGRDFALSAEGAPAPFYPGEHTRLLRFAVKAREIDARDRKPAVLTFVVDVSGSMNQENRLGLVKRALGLLLDELKADDRVGLVVYGTEGRVLLRHTRDLEEIRRAIAHLEPEGSTNAEAGLRLAYDLADEGWRQGAINKILLCSDGVANVGATGPESILARIGKEAQRGIELTTIGFGMGNYNDALMEQLADQGDGTYHYVDQLAEARKVFVDNLTGTLETVAKEAKAQVEFNPETVVRYRLLGYENRDVADRDFRNDRIDAGELGAGHQATALYEVRLRDGVSGGDRIATLRLRWKSVATKAIEEESRELRARDLDRSWQDASANFHQAALAAAFAEKLKETAAADDFGWRSLRREAARLDDELRRRPSAGDLADAIDRAARIAGVTADRDDRDGRDDRRRGDDEDRDDRPRNPRLDED